MPPHGVHYRSAIARMFRQCGKGKALYFEESRFVNLSVYSFMFSFRKDLQMFGKLKNQELRVEQQFLTLIGYSRHVIRQTYTVESQYDEGPKISQNMFTIMRFCYIRALFHMFYYHGVMNIVCYTGDFVT